MPATAETPVQSATTWGPFQPEATRPDVAAMASGMLEIKHRDDERCAGLSLEDSEADDNGLGDAVQDDAEDDGEWRSRCLPAARVFPFLAT